MKKHKLIRITTVSGSLGLIKGQYSFMSDYFEVFAVSSPGEGLDVLKTRDGVKTYAVEMTRQISFFKDLIALWKLFCFFKKENPMIVHTHTPKAGILGMTAAYFASVPIRLHTVAGMPLMESVGIKKLVLSLVERATYFFSTFVYPNSYGLYDFILEQGYTRASKMRVIGNGSSNGIDIEHFSKSAIGDKQAKGLKDKLKISENTTVFCFVGRLVGDKGINELVRAFVRLFEENKTVKLLLVGRFEKELDRLSIETEKLIESHEAIIRVGHQKDVRPFMAISDIFTFPSYREGFPNVVMEAGAMGLPCIVSDINGCNEIIKHEVNGLIVPPKKIDELYLAMKKILNDQEIKDRIKSEARNMIEQRYKRKEIWEELLKEYYINMEKCKK